MNLTEMKSKSNVRMQSYQQDYQIKQKKQTETEAGFDKIKQNRIEQNKIVQNIVVQNRIVQNII